MKNLEFPGEEPNEFQKIGVYFRSEKDIPRHYLIEFTIPHEENCWVNIYLVDQADDTMEIGEEFCTYHYSLTLTLDIWPKYYFPGFPDNNYQFYHDDGDVRFNQIQGMADVLSYALKEGIKFAKITLR